MADLGDGCAACVTHRAFAPPEPKRTRNAYTTRPSSLFVFEVDVFALPSLRFDYLFLFVGAWGPTCRCDLSPCRRLIVYPGMSERTALRSWVDGEPFSRASAGTPAGSARVRGARRCTAFAVVSEPLAQSTRRVSCNENADLLAPTRVSLEARVAW